jgi:tetratricopeptide (TPR) repeat protein
MTQPGDNAAALYRHGRELAELGRRDEAVRVLRASAEIEPHFKTLEVLGEVLIKLGRFTEAVVPLAAATTLNRQVRAPSLLAKALLAAGDRGAARQAARIATARDPANRLASEVLNATNDLAEDNDGPMSYPDALDRP